MRREIKRALSILIAFAVVFTCFPVLSGTAEADAASSCWKNVKASATGEKTTAVSWSKLSTKQQKKIHGITVFRNGKAVKNLSKTATTFNDKNLAVGTKYVYQIKTYKKTTKKVKMWYNKKTKKWQTKKPAKKYRGKKKTLKKTEYKYSNASPKKTTTTKTHTWDKGKVTKQPTTTKTGIRTYTCTKCGKTKTSEIPKIEERKSENNDDGDVVTPLEGTQAKTVTDYLGVKRTLTWDDDFSGWLSDDGLLIFSGDMIRYDRTVAGEFTISGGSVMVQTGGSDSATFYKKELNGSGTESIDLENTTSSMRNDMDQRFGLRMFGGDPSKLTYEVDHNIEQVNTYTQTEGILQFKPITRQYITASNGTYLQRVLQMEVGKLLYPHDTAIYGFNCMLMSPDRSVGCGFSNESVTISIKYAGKKVGEITWSPFGKTSSVNGMTPNRALAWRIAQEAIAANGGKKDYYTDMRWIQDYIANNYSYGQTVTGDGGASFSMGCEGGALVLETYSIKEYGTYGFNGYGRKNPKEETHTSFNLNSDPAVFFETQGNK